MSTETIDEARQAAEPLVAYVPLEQIDRCETNPRIYFDEEQLAQLANSIQHHGVIQAIIIRPVGDRFELVDGERRWRASKLAGLTTIKAEIQELSDPCEILEKQIAANAERADVSPVEQGRSYRRLNREFERPVEDIAKMAGISVRQAYARMRMADLIAIVEQALARELITLEMAEVIAGLGEGFQRAALEFAIGAQVDGQAVSITLHTGRANTIGQLKTWCRSNAEQPMAAARFDPNDADLLPMAGSCATCPKRSTNGDLFAADEEDICLDPGCFFDKARAEKARRKANLPELTKLSFQYPGSPEGVVGRGRWNEAQAEVGMTLPRPPYGEFEDTEEGIRRLEAWEQGWNSGWDGGHECEESFYAHDEEAVKLYREGANRGRADSQELFELLEASMDPETKLTRMKVDHVGDVMFRKCVIADEESDKFGDVIWAVLDEDNPEAEEVASAAVVTPEPAPAETKPSEAKKPAGDPLDIDPRREKLRLFKAEGLARRRAVDAILAMFDSPVDGENLSNACGESLQVLQAVALHAIWRGEIQWHPHQGDTIRPEELDVAGQTSGLPQLKTHYSYKGHEWPEAVPMEFGAIAAWRAIFCACSRPEIPLRDHREQPAIVIEAFAEAAGIDMAILRHDANEETKSKSRLAAEARLPNAVGADGSNEANVAEPEASTAEPAEPAELTGTPHPVFHWFDVNGQEWNPIRDVQHGGDPWNVKGVAFVIGKTLDDQWIASEISTGTTVSEPQEFPGDALDQARDRIESMEYHALSNLLAKARKRCEKVKHPASKELQKIIDRLAAEQNKPEPVEEVEAEITNEIPLTPNASLEPLASERSAAADGEPRRVSVKMERLGPMRRAIETRRVFKFEDQDARSIGFVENADGLESVTILIEATNEKVVVFCGKHGGKREPKGNK